MHTHEQDNFDDSGIRKPIATRSSPISTRYLSFLVDNANAFHAARGLLEDHASRDLFDRLILFRLLGHLHVTLPVSNRELLSRPTVPGEWKIDDTGDVGMFGPLSIFSVPYNGTEVWVKGGPSNVAGVFLSGQYHSERNGCGSRPSPATTSLTAVAAWEIPCACIRGGCRHQRLGLYVRPDVKTLRDYARGLPYEFASGVAH